MNENTQRNKNFVYWANHVWMCIKTHISSYDTSPGNEEYWLKWYKASKDTNYDIDGVYYTDCKVNTVCWGNHTDLANWMPGIIYGKRDIDKVFPKHKEQCKLFDLCKLFDVSISTLVTDVDLFDENTEHQYHDIDDCWKIVRAFRENEYEKGDMSFTEAWDLWEEYCSDHNNDRWRYVPNNMDRLYDTLISFMVKQSDNRKRLYPVEGDYRRRDYKELWDREYYENIYSDDYTPDEPYVAPLQQMKPSGRRINKRVCKQKPYVPGKRYDPNFCIHDNEWYVCIQDHISGNIFESRFWKKADLQSSKSWFTVRDVSEYVYDGDLVRLCGRSFKHWTNDHNYKKYTKGERRT